MRYLMCNENQLEAVEERVAVPRNHVNLKRTIPAEEGEHFDPLVST